MIFRDVRGVLSREPVHAAEAAPTGRRVRGRYTSTADSQSPCKLQ